MGTVGSLMRLAGGGCAGNDDVGMGASKRVIVTTETTAKMAASIPKRGLPSLSMGPGVG
jgi:hypothetical protein